MNILSGAELFARIKVKLASAKSARFAVAYWGSGAVEQLGLDGRKSIEVICNLSDGATNPAEVRKMIERGVKVSTLENLHAKCGLVRTERGKWGFLGSSNASQRGWRFFSDVDHLEELNIAVERSSEIDQLDAELDRLFARSRILDIGSAEFGLAEARWEIMQSARNRVVGEKISGVGRHATFLGHLLAAPDSEIAGTYFALTKKISREEEARFHHLSDGANANLGGPDNRRTYYWGWPELPSYGTLLAWERGKQGFKFDGIYERFGAHSVSVDLDGSVESMEPVYVRDGFQGFSKPQLRSAGRMLTPIFDEIWRSPDRKSDAVYVAAARIRDMHRT